MLDTHRKYIPVPQYLWEAGDKQKCAQVAYAVTCCEFYYNTTSDVFSHTDLSNSGSVS